MPKFETIQVMVRTNYDSIAERYDEDRRHWEIPARESLEKIVAESRSSVRVMDLACGTGSWLAAQSSRLGTTKVDWLGVDISPAMLVLARQKMPFARLALASAEDLPLEQGSCAYIAVNFAFHHFAGKDRALDEMARVLSSEGCLSIYTPQPNEMRDQWVYHFFEGTWELDQTRFWPADRLVTALERRGFTVNLEWDKQLSIRSLSEILRRAELRVISQLADIDDDPYRRGLEEIQKLASNPDAVYENPSAMIRLEASRG